MENEKNYIGVLLDDRYEILEKIGEGGMAVVYKAFCHRLSRFVAVKIMREEMAADEEFKRRFCAESHAIAMLSHPNIVAVYDVSHSDDVEYIVMELVDGITLKQYMDKRGAISWKEALHFTKQITKALAHAHSRGIIHRDIKPQNIMLLKDGTIKVADFGIAALENEMQESGQAVGSIHYIAPEQARGGYINDKADIYSVGVMLYEMLTGQLPFVADNAVSVAIMQMQAEPTPPSRINPSIPKGLEEITMHAMEKNPAQRFPSAADMLEDVERFRRKGVVYMTLCHNGDNDICDSASKTENEHNGVSPFGEKVIREMNRTGMMVDLSHGGEKSFYDAIEISNLPIVCSHSSSRALCNHPRNLTDDQLRALARKGGVAQVTFYKGFLREEGTATLLDAMEHLEHMIAVAGVEHVGIGSDFDGDGGVPGIASASEMINITRLLLRKRYSENDLSLIWGGNFLRVMQQVQDAAADA